MTITLLIQVGDSVTMRSPLMRVQGEGGTSSRRRLSLALRRGVIVDKERSLRYDPFYALRLLADVAIRALSPGINDPTTAVRALDEIEGVLRVAAAQPLGTRRLREGRAEVVIRAPAWPDVVTLALLEVILCGSGQPQVTRRLVALVDDLVSDLSDARDAPLLELRAELLARIDAHELGEHFTGIAKRGDRQGLGGTVAHAAG